MGLSLSKKVKSNSEQFEFSKEVQSENIKELLSQISHTEEGIHNYHALHLKRLFTEICHTYQAWQVKYADK